MSGERRVGRGHKWARAWTKEGLQRMAVRISRARACELCRKGAAYARTSRIRCVPDPEGRHERGEEGDDDDPQVVVDRVLRIVLDVVREVGRGPCWEVDRGSWHVEGRIG